MPLYDYDCSACGHRVEVMHGVHADGPTICPNCGSDRVRKAFAAPAVHFKGSGWAKKERRATSTPGTSKAASSDGQGRSDGGSSDGAPSPTGDGGSSAAGGSSTRDARDAKETKGTGDGSSTATPAAASAASTD